MSGADGSSSNGERPDDLAAMRRALELAASVRTRTSPNPWVGVVVRSGDQSFEGATEPPGGDHAEIVALAAAGERARGATLYTTLEPCAHQGRTPPCAPALVEAGIARVVVGVLDPDPQVSGRGVASLRQAGLDVDVGVARAEVEEQMAPYLKHRRTGRPWVVLKLACSLDGRIAAPDRSSRWLTGAEARADAHRLRAESDVVLVGAGTVRADDPELTVRTEAGSRSQPLRVVLGKIPPRARVEPALEMGGDIPAVLDQLGAKGILQVLVEGGARVAHAFHSAGLVDRYVFYFAPALFGGDDALAMFAGPGAGDMSSLWRGHIVHLERLGSDLKVELAPEVELAPDEDPPTAGHVTSETT
jgi:diaminohydroxyphosphoribosylaminopyrimidine deaminase / 5-amino-6-(5-phosphoribosylamino)uracil reductase